MQHALAPDELAQVTAHLDECDACQQIVVAAVRGGVAMQNAATLDERSDERLEASRIEADVTAIVPLATQVGRYELRSLLGAGGMGAVYDAHDAELDRAVALKVLRPELGRAPLLAGRLVHESRLMAKVAHPSVITVYDVGRAGDVVFIAMELIRGTTLTAWLASHRPDWRATIALFERAGQGLDAAHGAGIVHRDFKPDNVLVERGGQRVVVTDFGIAREAARPASEGVTATSLPDDLRATEAGFVAGTPAYMAPEQLAGHRVDHRADIFAFSVALWEAVFHSRPFPGSTIAEIVAAMRRRVPIRPPAGAPRVPRRLVRVLRRGLAIDPRDRWPDMPSMLVQLAAIRSFRARAAVAACAAGLVGVGIAAALVVAPPAPPIDSCEHALSVLDQAYNPHLEELVNASLAHEPKLRDAVIGKLRATAEAWRTTHLATCRADRDVVQDPRTVACLDVRRLELAGSVGDLIANGAAGAPHARSIHHLPGDPSACATSAPEQPHRAHIEVEEALVLLGGTAGL